MSSLQLMVLLMYSFVLSYSLLFTAWRANSPHGLFTAYNSALWGLGLARTIRLRVWNGDNPSWEGFFARGAQSDKMPVELSITEKKVAKQYSLPKLPVLCVCDIVI